MTERNEQQRTAPYPAEKARGGEIILRTPLRRAIFIAGLAGAMMLALLLALCAICSLTICSLKWAVYPAAPGLLQKKIRRTGTIER